MNETYVTVCGNLTADPDRITSDKGDFTTFRVAVNEFHRDQVNGGYVDGRSSFYKVVAYRAVGANAHKSLSKGEPVLIHGKLRMSQWQGANGETRSAPEIEAVNIGPDLRFGIATFQRVPGQGQRAGAAALPSWRQAQSAPTVDAWPGAEDLAGAAELSSEPSEVGELDGPAAERLSGPLVEQHAS